MTAGGWNWNLGSAPLLVISGGWIQNSGEPPSSDTWWMNLELLSNTWRMDLELRGTALLVTQVVGGSGTVRAYSHCRTPIRTRTQIPYTAMGDKDPSLDLCNVNFQHITIVAKGKTLRIRVKVRVRIRQSERAITLWAVCPLVVTLETVLY